MINVLENVKDKYKSDSTQKNYFIVFRDLGKMLTNSDIVSQSLEITESICSSGNFSIGLCESANMSVEVALNDNVTGDEVEIFQVLDDFEPEITYTDGQPIQLSGTGITPIETSYVDDNLIHMSTTPYFDANKYYLIMLRLNYVGDEIYLYTEMAVGTDRVLYYMSPNQKGFVDLDDWVSGESYSFDSKVKHDNRVWRSRTNSNSAEPSDESNAWDDVTAYINVCIPIIGSNMFMYEMKLLTKNEGLTGVANFYEIANPVMPLGLFSIKSCKRKNLSPLRQLTGYDRMQDVALSTSVYYENPQSQYVTIGEIVDDAAATTQIIVGGNLSTNTEKPEVTGTVTTTATFPTGDIYKVRRDETQTTQGNYNADLTDYDRNQRAEVVGSIEEVTSGNTDEVTLNKYVRGQYKEDNNGSYSRREERVIKGSYTDNAQDITDNSNGLRLPTYTRTQKLVEQFAYTDSNVSNAEKVGTRRQTEIKSGSYSENADAIKNAAKSYTRTERRVIKGAYREVASGSAKNWNGRNQNRKRRERQVITAQFQETSSGDRSYTEYRVKRGYVSFKNNSVGIIPDIYLVYTANSSHSYSGFGWPDAAQYAMKEDESHHFIKIVSKTDSEWKYINLKTKRGTSWVIDNYATPTTDSGYTATSNQGVTSLTRGGVTFTAPTYAKNTIFWLNGIEVYIDGKDIYQYKLWEESKVHKYKYNFSLPSGYTWETTSGYSGESTTRSHFTNNKSHDINNPRHYENKWYDVSNSEDKVYYNTTASEYLFKCCYKDFVFGYNYSIPSGFAWESGYSEKLQWSESGVSLPRVSMRYSNSWVVESNKVINRASPNGSGYYSEVYDYQYDRCYKTITYCYNFSLPSGYTWNNDEASAYQVSTSASTKKTFTSSDKQYTNTWAYNDSSNPHTSLILGAENNIPKYFYRSCYKDINFKYLQPASGTIDFTSYTIGMNNKNYTCPIKYNYYFNDAGIRYCEAVVYASIWITYHKTNTYFYKISLPEGFTVDAGPAHSIAVTSSKTYTCEDTVKWGKAWVANNTSNPTKFTQENPDTIYTYAYYRIHKVIKYLYEYSGVEGWSKVGNDATAKYTDQQRAGQNDVSVKYADAWNDSSLTNPNVGGTAYNYKEALFRRQFKYKYNYYDLGNTWTYSSQFENTRTELYTPALTNTNRYSKIFTNSDVYVYSNRTKVFLRTLKFGYVFSSMPDWNIINQRTQSELTTENPNRYDYTKKGDEVLYKANSVSTDDTQHGYKIYELVTIYKVRWRDYERSLYYAYQETAKITTVTYWIKNYDGNLSYVAYIHHPVDWGVYLDEPNIKQIGLDLIQEETSEDGLFHSQGVVITDRQSEIQNAIINLSTIVAEVDEDEHTFTVSYISALSYTGTGGVNDTYSVSGTYNALNPYFGCISHNKKEQFNTMSIAYGSNSIHTTRRDVVQGFLELHGLFINFDRYGVSTLRNIKLAALYPSETLFPHDDDTLYPMMGMDEYASVSLCKSMYVDDIIHEAFDGICIVKQNTSIAEEGLYPFYYNRMSRKYGTIPENMPHIGFWESNNYYVLENNFFIDNFIFTQAQLEDICEKIISNLGDLQYFNMTAELKCLPYLEVGDSLNVAVPGNAYDTVILRRRMKGNTNQMDNIETDFD